jgi:hypothetical protein
MAKRSPFFLADGKTVIEVAVHETRAEAEAENVRMEDDAQKRMIAILDHAKMAAKYKGMTQGTILLFLAVGALTQEEKETSEIHTAVDFIIDGFNLHLSELFKKA